MNQRMKWDAEAAFKRMNDKLRHHAVEPHEYIGGYTVPYTPPSNIGPERLAQLRKYEPPAKPHGRDIESLMRYHEAHKKGRTDDDCLREKFGSGESGKNVSGDTPRAATMPTGACHPPVCPAPTPPHSADGPWPRWAVGASHRVLMRSAREFDGIAFDNHGYASPATCVWWRGSEPVWTTEAEALQWLEQHGHKDAAAQLRVTPRADVATGGGRVWRGACCDWAVIGERCYIGPSRRDMKGGWEDSKCDPNKMPDHWPELFGPERDAILSECRKAMGL